MVRKSKRIWSGASVNISWEDSIEKSLRIGFSATNNETKYEALLAEMAMVQKMR